MDFAPELVGLNRPAPEPDVDLRDTEGADGVLAQLNRQVCPLSLCAGCSLVWCSQVRSLQTDNKTLRGALEEAKFGAAQKERALYENTKLKAELLHANQQLKKYDETTAGSQLLRADLEGQVQALQREVHRSISRPIARCLMLCAATGGGAAIARLGQSFRSGRRACSPEG